MTHSIIQLKRAVLICPELEVTKRTMAQRRGAPSGAGVHSSRLDRPGESLKQRLNAMLDAQSVSAIQR